MMPSIHVVGADFSTAWLKTVLAVSECTDSQALHTVTRVQDTSLPEVPDIRAAADAVLAETDLPSIRTVANTIFPRAIADQTPEPDALAERYAALYPTLKQVEPHRNSRGTYFLRLVAYPGPDGTVNQLGHLIRTLRTELANDRPKRARYETGFGATPSSPVALPIFEPGADTAAMAFPCLSLLSFQHDRTHLHAVAHYRSQYLTQRGYGNYLGITELINYVAEHTALTAGALTIVAGQAHADRMTQRRTRTLRAIDEALRTPA